MQQTRLGPPPIDLCALPRNKALPQRFFAWLLILGGGINVALFLSLLWRGNREGLGPGLLMLLMLGIGVAELSGALSRRRWRRAYRHVAARSSPSVVRWRYEWQYGFGVACGLIGAGFVALLLAMNPFLGPVLGTALAFLVVLPCVYIAVGILVNTRCIACDRERLTYFSGPVPLRPRREASFGHVIVTASADSGITLCASSPTGLTPITSVCSPEMALCLADELNARLAALSDRAHG